MNHKTQKTLREYYKNPPKLLKTPLEKSDLIAYIASPNLGDTLICLVTVHNLLQNGYKVDVYGDYAYALCDWFPEMQIYKSIPISEQRIFEKYNAVLHMHERELSRELSSWHPNSVVLFHESLHKILLSEVDLQLITCKIQLGLENVVRSNGMKPPANLIKHKNKNKIMLHPTSTATLKNWPAQKYLALAKALTQKGYEPSFIVSKDEKPEWDEIIQSKFPLPAFNSLSDVAKNLYEAKYFIGNDSGIGHLASSVGTPTLTIVMRKSIAIHWRPAFAPGEIVLPPPWLNPRFIREKFWKQCVSVEMVLKKFEQLTHLGND